MPGINGIILLIAGIAISITAYFVDINNLVIFFYAGIAMTVYGLIKIIIQKALTGGTPKEKKNIQQIMKTEQKRTAVQTIKYCTKCGKAHGVNANYCINCGTKL